MPRIRNRRGVAVEHLHAQLIARAQDYASANAWAWRETGSAWCPPRHVEDELAECLEALGLAAIRYARAIASAGSVSEGVALTPGASQPAMDGLH